MVAPHSRTAPCRATPRTPPIPVDPRASGSRTRNGTRSRPGRACAPSPRCKGPPTVAATGRAQRQAPRSADHRAAGPSPGPGVASRTQAHRVVGPESPGRRWPPPVLRSRTSTFARRTSVSVRSRASFAGVFSKARRPSARASSRRPSQLTGSYQPPLNKETKPRETPHFYSAQNENLSLDLKRKYP